MKQINECLDRHFTNMKPLKKKWQAIRHPEHNNVLLLFHYHHLVLVVNLDTKEILKQWWELPTDKRGLDAAKEYLRNNKYID